MNRPEMQACHPQMGAEKQNMKSSGPVMVAVRGGKRQRHQNGSGLFAVFLAGTEDEGRHDAKVAEGLRC